MEFRNTFVVEFFKKRDQEPNWNMNIYIQQNIKV